MSTVDAFAPLTAGERDAITGFRAHYPTARAACIDALRHVQKGRNWVSDPVLDEVAALLGMSPAELDEIATFYNLIFRKPVGETVLFLCDSITCWIMGRDALATRIGDQFDIRAGETTRDGRLTLLPIVCLGHCDHAPALMLGETLHGDVDAAALDRLLDPLRQARG
jgi:NADH-quinone oxidoreductase subunit E